MDSSIHEHADVVQGQGLGLNPRRTRVLDGRKAAQNGTREGKLVKSGHLGQAQIPHARGAAAVPGLPEMKLKLPLSPRPEATGTLSLASALRGNQTLHSTLRPGQPASVESSLLSPPLGSAKESTLASPQFTFDASRSPLSIYPLSTRKK